VTPGLFVSPSRAAVTATGPDVPVAAVLFSAPILPFPRRPGDRVGAAVRAGSGHSTSINEGGFDALLTLEQCRAHCRIDGDFDDAILGDLLAAASDAAAAYLGRELYADQAALDQALDQLPQDMAAAVTGHEAAVAAANAETNAARPRPCVMWPIAAWPWRPRAVRACCRACRSTTASVQRCACCWATCTPIAKPWSSLRRRSMHRQRRCHRNGAAVRRGRAA
jgi:hypothetical protein